MPDFPLDLCGEKPVFWNLLHCFKNSLMFKSVQKLLMGNAFPGEGGNYQKTTLFEVMLLVSNGLGVVE